MGYIAVIVFFLCVAVGMLVFTCTEHYYKKDILRTLLNNASNANNEREIARYQFEIANESESYKRDLGNLILGLIAAIILFVACLNSFKNECMNNAINGKYEVEQVIREKTRNGITQVDTTYNFYKKKNIE